MTAYPLLDTIQSPADLRRLDRKQLPQLAEDLRRQRQDAALVLLLDRPEDVS